MQLQSTLPWATSGWHDSWKARPDDWHWRGKVQRWLARQEGCHARNGFEPVRLDAVDQAKIHMPTAHQQPAEIWGSELPHAASPSAQIAGAMRTSGHLWQSPSTWPRPPSRPAAGCSSWPRISNLPRHMLPTKRQPTACASAAEKSAWLCCACQLQALGLKPLSIIRCTDARRPLAGQAHRVLQWVGVQHMQVRLPHNIGHVGCEALAEGHDPQAANLLGLQQDLKALLQRPASRRSKPPAAQLRWCLHSQLRMSNPAVLSVGIGLLSISSTGSQQGQHQ